MPFLRQVERQWLARHITATTTAQTPLGQLRRMYWIQYIGGSPSKRGIDEIEQAFLVKFIGSKGQTAAKTNFTSSLWCQAVASLGIKPSVRVMENRLLFYLNAP